MSLGKALEVLVLQVINEAAGVQWNYVRSGALRFPSGWVRILATVRGETGHPLGVTVPKRVGFQIQGL